MPFLNVNEVEIPYLLRRSLRAKRLQIIAKEKYFEVVAPLKIKNIQVVHFLQENKKWLLKKCLEKNKQTPMQPLIWAGNEVVPYRGQQLLINLKMAQQSIVTLRPGSLWVGLPPHLKIDAIEMEIKRKTTLWYKAQAKRLIEQTLADLCPRVGRWPISVTLKKQKTRWGSCGPDNKIYINWLLILAPPGVLEYVITHEVCHLFHKNHSQRFWHKVEQCMPNYKEYEKWLRQNGSSLITDLI